MNAKFLLTESHDMKRPAPRSFAVEIGENGPASGKLIETRKFADKNQLSFPETLRVEYDDSAARYSLGYAGSAGANHGLTILFR